MTNKSKVPQIRFSGFKGEWEESKLGNKVEFFTGLTYSPNSVVKDNGTLVLRSSNVKDGQIVDADNVYVNSDVVNCNNVLPGDIAVVVRNGSRSLIGKHAQIQKEMKNTVIGAFMTGIRSEQPSFTNALLDSSKFSKEIEKNLGATINQITTGAFKKMIFFFPEQNEQTKIGDYFQQLDKLIEQKEKKYQKLKQFKKAMLSKMFPKNGANTPEIRFKGFSGEWEEKKLGDIGEIVTGSTPSTQEPLYYSNDGIPWVTPTDISENVTFFTARCLSEKGQKVARIVPKNTLLVTCIASIGKNTLLGAMGSFNQQINGLVSNENEYNPYFLFTESSIWSDKMKKLAASGTMQIVNKKEFSELIAFIPNLAEQTKIGNYFQKLDTQIELQLQEIEKLKNIKKASLAKMFV